MAGDFSEKALGGRVASFRVGSVSSRDLSRMATYESTRKMNYYVAHDRNLSQTKNYRSRSGETAKSTPDDYHMGRLQAFHDYTNHVNKMKVKPAEQMKWRNKGYGAKG